MREENTDSRTEEILEAIEAMPYRQKEKMLTEMAEELSHFSAGSGKEMVEPLSEKEYNVILSRIAGELGLSDASKLPYASQITRRH